MSIPQQDYREIETALGFRDTSRPIVKFYDHAVQDGDATARSGRPRFQPVVYVSIKPTAADLTVRDVKSRRATEQDKYTYQPEWQRYLAQKEGDGSPPLDGIPGMTVDAKAELEALGLRTVSALAKHEGDISPWDELREKAQKIMRIADGTDASGPENGAASEQPCTLAHGNDYQTGTAFAGLPPVNYQVSYTFQA